MKFKRVYKCRRCGEVFVGDKVFDQKSSDRFESQLHSHNCGDNSGGLAVSVGYDVVPDSGDEPDGTVAAASGKLGAAIIAAAALTVAVIMLTVIAAATAPALGTVFLVALAAVAAASVVVVVVMTVSTFREMRRPLTGDRRWNSQRR